MGMRADVEAPGWVALSKKSVGKATLLVRKEAEKRR